MLTTLPLARLLRAAAVFAVALLATSLSAKTHVKIATTAAAMDAFNNWTATTSWENIKSFNNGNASRPVVDLVLQLQALRAGGLDFDFELVRALTYDLAKKEVIEARCDLSAETIWGPEIEANADAVLATEPFLALGEFVKGVYVLPTNERLLKLNSAADFKEATGVVVSSWEFDGRTLQALSPKGVVKVATPELAYAAVQKGQADFMLDEFSAAPDLSMVRNGIRLVPVPGHKVALGSYRAYIVSKKSPAAQAIHQALTAGAKSLRANGTVQRAYTESGFFNPKVADWKQVN